MTEKIKWSTSAAIARRLGDQLIKDPHTAFFELIKNSYDADATEVEVNFHRPLSDAAKIVIRDNGTGMTIGDLRTKWARAAGENKVQEPYTPCFSRRRLGAKGIGRFSSAKLGDNVKVITKTERDRLQIQFTINFAAFTDDKDFEDMDFQYTEGAPRRGFQRGTILELSALRDRWGKREIRKIRHQLSHLIDPDVEDQNFRIIFKCREFLEFDGPLDNPIAGKETHRVGFSIEPDGRYERTVEINGLPKNEKELRTPLPCGPVKGVIRYYKHGVKQQNRKLSEGAEESHMGVKVYRDGCRVRPYGETSDDWLSISSKRARAGGKYYVQPLAVAGSVHISATGNNNLTDATNREAGMIENEEFGALQRFVLEHVELLNKLLEQETRSESIKQKRHTVRKILNTVIDCLQRQDSEVYKGYVSALDRRKRGESGQTVTRKETRVIDVKPATKEEWYCASCDARWRVPSGQTPKVCMDVAVNRKGQPQKSEGCGSANIHRSKHESRTGGAEFGAIVPGKYATISGKQIKVKVDYEMGEDDDEFSVDEREIVINGNHRAYRLAEYLDQVSGKKYEIGDDVFVPALTIHITKNVCLAWAELHFHTTKEWSEFRNRYESLQAEICASVLTKLAL